jgi:hypothetical protein
VEVKVFTGLIKDETNTRPEHVGLGSGKCSIHQHNWPTERVFVVVVVEKSVLLLKINEQNIQIKDQPIEDQS